VFVNSAFLTGNHDSRRVEKTNHDRCNFRRSRSVIYDRRIGDLTENRFELNTRLRCILEAAGPRRAKAQLGLISSAVQPGFSAARAFASLYGRIPKPGGSRTRRQERPLVRVPTIYSTLHVIYLHFFRGAYPSLHLPTYGGMIVEVKRQRDSRVPNIFLYLRDLARKNR